MHIIDVLTSHQLIKRFCRDYSVPVSTFSYPHFEKQLETLSIHNASYHDAFMQFVEEVTTYNSAEEYFAYYNGVKEAIINHISNHPQFIKFSNTTFEKGTYSNKELYSETNHAKAFVSIDLRKANFSIVKKHCPDVFGDSTWEEVVEQFGGSPYLQKSKYIRQVIFGACNPKKQIQAQTEYMTWVARYMESKGFKIYSVATDEIILEDYDYDRVMDALSECHLYDTTIMKVERFWLTKLGTGYIKTITSSSDIADVGKVHFKCVDGDFYCQFVKHYYHKPIEESDLIFDYKGTIAKFIAPMGLPLHSLIENNNTSNDKIAE